MSVELLRRQLTGHGPYKPIDVERVLYWSEYSAKAVAKIQARGMPIDPHCGIWCKRKICGHRCTGPAFRSKLLRWRPEAHYTMDGEWSNRRFERWLIHVGITEWPRLFSGKIQIDGDAFGMMYHAHPALEGLHALRDSLGVIMRARIPIGPDGRNRPSLFPFGTATGRNAQAKSLFNAHASMRSFMKFPEDSIAIYLDWRTQEVGVAAAFSGDERLAEDYRAPATFTMRWQAL